MKKGILLLLVIAAACCLLYLFTIKSKASKNAEISDASAQQFEGPANERERHLAVVDRPKSEVKQAVPNSTKLVGAGIGPGLPESSLQLVTGDRPQLEAHLNWPEARVISVWEGRLSEGRVRRVSLVQPDDLSYPIRIEEIEGDDGTLASRTEMVANRFVLKVKRSSAHLLEDYLIDHEISFEEVSSIGLYRVEVDYLSPDAVQAGMHRVLSEFPDVEYAEPDYISRIGF